mmetsp:Transcript_8908/g.22250  ORF Transcript_8908/g.22250 Transcript_8908/m.22250 type:complete len:325 (-) Transcript_8908:32-1006(-)
MDDDPHTRSLSSWWSEETTTDDSQNAATALFKGPETQVFELDGPQDAPEESPRCPQSACFTFAAPCPGLSATDLLPLGSGARRRIVGDWAENAGHCSVCTLALGKRRLRPRHHCRICGRSVCAKCSKSTVQLEGWKRPERACTPCAAVSLEAPALRNRLALLEDRLRSLSHDGSTDGKRTTGFGISPATSTASSETGTVRRQHPARSIMEDSPARCEGALRGVEDITAPAAATSASLDLLTPQLSRCGEGSSDGTVLGGRAQPIDPDASTPSSSAATAVAAAADIIRPLQSGSPNLSLHKAAVAVPVLIVATCAGLLVTAYSIM